MPRTIKPAPKAPEGEAEARINVTPKAGDGGGAAAPISEHHRQRSSSEPRAAEAPLLSPEQHAGIVQRRGSAATPTAAVRTQIRHVPVPEVRARLNPLRPVSTRGEQADREALRAGERPTALMGMGMGEEAGAEIGNVRPALEQAEAERRAQEAAERERREAEARRKAEEDERQRQAEAARRAAALAAAEPEQAAAPEGGGLEAPLLAAGAAAPAGRMDWLTKGWRDENGKLSTKSKITIATTAGVIGAGLMGFLLWWFLGRKISDSIIIANRRENTTVYDGEVGHPLNETVLSGADQSVVTVLLFTYAALNRLAGNFTLHFADREALLDARNVNGSFSVPFGSLAEANSAFNLTQAVGAGSEESRLDLAVYAFDAKNRSTETIAAHTHYIPGPPPPLPLMISGVQNGTIGRGQTYKPFSGFAVQNLEATEANSAHFAMLLEPAGNTSCNLTGGGKLIVSINSQYPQRVASLDFNGSTDLVPAMQGIEAGCEGDSATFYTQIFDTAGSRNASNTLSSKGTYIVPPSPTPSPSPSPSPTPTPSPTPSPVPPTPSPAGPCDYVTVGGVPYTTLANVPFNPFETAVPQLNANRFQLTGKFGYYYLAPPNVYTGFADMGCAPQFDASSFTGNTRYCITSKGGLSVIGAEALFKQGITLQLLAGSRKGNAYPVGLVFQSDQPGCPQNNTGTVAVIYPALIKAQQAQAANSDKEAKPA